MKRARPINHQVNSENVDAHVLAYMQHEVTIEELHAMVKAESDHQAHEHRERVDMKLQNALDPAPVRVQRNEVSAEVEKETATERNKRRYQLCIDAGLKMPDNDYATLPVGIGAIAATEGISKAAFSKSVKAHIAACGVN